MSFKLKSFIKNLLVVVIGALVVALVMRGFSAIIGGGTPKEEKPFDPMSVISEYGWKVDPASLELTEVTIPEKFDEVYEQYNGLQKKQDMNLEKYKGKVAQRYTYKVLNYPENPDKIRINLLVINNKLVAGDVSSIEPGGFMHTLDPEVGAFFSE